MIWISNDDVVENFDFEKLTGSNEITGDFDVRFRWSGFAAYAADGISGVIPHPVLCRMTSDLP
jgi:hypothetical protein